MTLFVGTSGWAYKEWKPDFYPADLPQTRFLEHYGNSLDACEINATFYRLQAEDTLKKWANQTPDPFRFSLKAHRGLTHGKTVGPTEEKSGLLSAFLDRSTTLGERLGAILFQFPPYRHRDDDGLDALLKILPEGRYVFEFRHESWDTSVVRQRIAEAGASVCLSNTDGTVPESLPPGPLAYLRLRTDRYSDEARSAWRDLLAKSAVERDVFAFTKHEGIPADDPYGGIGLACW